MAGTLFVVATPIGNLEDITLRALRVLKEVDIIAAEDTRHSRKLLTHFDIHTPLTSFFQGNERGKVAPLIAQLKEGKNIALISDAGTPAISDPGYVLVSQAVEAGITVVPIPGACAAISALCAAGLPTDRFLFVGFLPEKPGKRMHALEALLTTEATLVIYVSPWKAAKTLADCAEVFGGRDAVLAREITKLHEEFRRGSLTELAAEVVSRPPKGEMVLLIRGA